MVNNELFIIFLLKDPPSKNKGESLLRRTGLWSRLFKKNDFFVCDKGYLFKNGVVKMSKSDKLSKKEIKELIYTDLSNQLFTNGKLGKYYYDLIEDYIYFWELKYKLQKDIKNSGLRYETTNGNGISSTKPNESVQNLIKVNAQMLKILSDLNLQEPSIPSPVGKGKVDANDLLQRDL